MTKVVTLIRMMRLFQNAKESPDTDTDNLLIIKIED